SDPAPDIVDELDGASEPERFDRGPDNTLDVHGQVPCGVHGRGYRDVSGDAAREVEVRESSHRLRVTSAAKNPAPNPLSMFTHTTCGVQELSIPRSAARPPNDVP